MAARPSWRGQIRLALVSIPVEIYPGDQVGRDRSPFTRSTSRRASASNMRRSCPGSARSTATKSSRAMKCRKGEYVLLDPEEIEKVKLESRKTLELTQFVDLARHRPDLLRQALFRRPRRRPRRGSVRRAARGAAARRRRSASASWRCAARNMSSASSRAGAAWCSKRCAMPTRSTRPPSYFRDIGDAKPDPDLLDLAETLIEKKAGDVRRRQVRKSLCRRAARR